MKPAADDDLIVRLRAGDRKALGQWLADNRAFLKAAAGRHLGTQASERADASDVVQDVALYLLRKLADFQGTTVGEFRRWVRLVLSHKAVDQVRKTRRQPRAAGAVPTAENPDGNREALDRLALDLSTPSRKLIREELRAALLQALGALPGDQRQAVCLKHLQGWSLTTIAAHLQRSPSAVGQLIYRGMKALRRRLQDSS